MTRIDKMIIEFPQGAEIPETEVNHYYQIISDLLPQGCQLTLQGVIIPEDLPPHKE